MAGPSWGEFLTALNERISGLCDREKIRNQDELGDRLLAESAPTPGKTPGIGLFLRDAGRAPDGKPWPVRSGGIVERILKTYLTELGFDRTKQLATGAGMKGGASLFDWWSDAEDFCAVRYEDGHTEQIRRKNLEAEQELILMNQKRKNFEMIGRRLRLDEYRHSIVFPEMAARGGTWGEALNRLAATGSLPDIPDS